MLAVLHGLNLAAAHADRSAVLCAGRLVADDAPWDVLTESLLSEVYGCPIAVSRHPVRGCPLVMPLPERYADRTDASLHPATLDHPRGPVMDRSQEPADAPEVTLP